MFFVKSSIMQYDSPGKSRHPVPDSGHRRWVVREESLVFGVPPKTMKRLTLAVPASLHATIKDRNVGRQ